MIWMAANSHRRLAEVAGVFLRLGATAFGGPAAHIALMRRELVERRGWVSGEEFGRMLTACNLVPGPGSTQLAMLLGRHRAGRGGMLVAGGLFILPAALAMLLLASAYTRLGDRGPLHAALLGVRPVVVGIVAWALVDLARKLVVDPGPAALAVGVGVGSWLGVSPVALIAVAGLARALGTRPDRTRLLPLVVVTGLSARAGLGRLPELILAFLLIGATSFGSGYVLLPLLRDAFVSHHRWLSDVNSSMRSPSARPHPARSSPPPPSSATSLPGYQAPPWPLWRSSCHPSYWCPRWAR